MLSTNFQAGLGQGRLLCCQTENSPSFPVRCLLSPPAVCYKYSTCPRLRSLYISVSTQRLYRHFNPYPTTMLYLSFVNALFILIRLVSSGLVPHNLYPRQALNSRPLQYCQTQVGLGGCPYPCVDGKCPCYEFCTDGNQVCNFQLDGSVVFQYCVAVRLFMVTYPWAR